MANTTLVRHSIINYFNFAAQLAIDADSKYSVRKAAIGAVGFRRDGVIVYSVNAGDQRNISPKTHAETRLIRKLGGYSPVIYVARIRRDTKSFALARPCVSCFPAIQHAKIGKVYYTINENTYGLIDLSSMREYEYEFLKTNELNLK